MSTDRCTDRFFKWNSVADIQINFMIINESRSSFWLLQVIQTQPFSKIYKSLTWKEHKIFFHSKREAPIEGCVMAIDIFALWWFFWCWFHFTISVIVGSVLHNETFFYNISKGRLSIWIGQSLNIDFCKSEINRKILEVYFI